MTDYEYASELLDAWEASNKQGQLTLWVFLSLFEHPKSIVEIRQYLEKSTQGALRADDKSLYRSLRRYTDVELVDYSTRLSQNGGPPLKVYSLTPLGEQTLRDFVARNVMIVINNQEIKELIK